MMVGVLKMEGWNRKFIFNNKQKIMCHLKRVILITTILSFSILSLFAQDQNIFNILNKIEYPNNTITDKGASANLKDFLSNDEIAEIENWRRNQIFLENLNIAECMGCSRKWKDYKPVYKYINSKYFHFGIKSSIGIENIVFTKTGKFVVLFYSYQGVSKLEMETYINSQDINKSSSNNFVSRYEMSIYPTKIENKKCYLEHIESKNENYTNWYSTSSPLRLDYYINLKETTPKLRFIFKEGLYTYQNKDENGNRRHVDFYEPHFEKEIIGGKETYTCHILGYSSEYSFYLINLNQQMKVSIDINSNIKNTNFLFSILKNTKYKSIDEYINSKEKQYSKYEKKLKKGSYIIKVKNTINVDNFEPCFTIKIERTFLN